MPDALKCVVLFQGMNNFEEDARHEINDEGLGLHESGGDELSSDEDEAKVISKGVARLIVSGGEQSPPVNTTAQEIRPEPRVLASAMADPVIEDYVEPEEAVQRLESPTPPGMGRIRVGKAKFEQLEARPDEAERQEAQWGRNLVSGGRMLLIGGAVVIVLVVLLVAMRGLFDGGFVKTEIIPPPIATKDGSDVFKGSPEKWMRARSGRIGTDALVVLKSFIDASDDQSRSEWVRNPEGFQQHVQKWTTKIDPLIEPTDQQRWDIGHTGDTAYLILTARNREYLPFRAYFTREGEGLKLDWDATVAWSDVSLQSIHESALKRGGPANDSQRKAGVVALYQLNPSVKSHLPDEIYTGSVLIRCMLRKKNEFYAGPYNDQDHSAFMLLSADKMHHMWGYTPKGSELDLQLRSILDHGSFVVNLKKDRRVTLRVRVNEKDALPSQLEMVKLVNLEWVTPD